MTREELMSFRIVEAVANQEGVSPTELTPPLYDVIDTDALDSLYGASTASRSQPALEFTYKGYQIHVDSTGEVFVDESNAMADSDAHGLSC